MDKKNFDIKYDTKKKIQEQLELLLDCEDGRFAKIIQIRIDSLVKVYQLFGCSDSLAFNDDKS